MSISRADRSRGKCSDKQLPRRGRNRRRTSEPARAWSTASPPAAVNADLQGHRLRQNTSPVAAAPAGRRTSGPRRTAWVPRGWPARPASSFPRSGTPRLDSARLRASDGGSCPRGPALPLPQHGCRSWDGKAAVDWRTQGISSDLDRELFHHLRTQADARDGGRGHRPPGALRLHHEDGQAARETRGRGAPPSAPFGDRVFPPRPARRPAASRRPRSAGGDRHRIGTRCCLILGRPGDLRAGWARTHRAEVRLRWRSTAFDLCSPRAGRPSPFLLAAHLAGTSCSSPSIRSCWAAPRRSRSSTEGSSWSRPRQS